MPNGKTNLPPKVKQQLAEDARKGRLNPTLKALRINAARTGNYKLLQDYLNRHHIDDDLDEFHSLLAQQSQGIGLPFDLPRPEEYQKLEAGGDFRLGTIGRQGQGLYLDLQTALPLGLSVVGGTGTGKTTLFTSIGKGLSEHENIGCWIFNVRNEVNELLPGFTSIKMSEILPNLFERKPYLTPETQAAKLADIIASTFYLLWSKTAISIELAKFYQAKQNPTLQDVRNAICNLKSGKTSGLHQQQVSKLVGVFDFLAHCFQKETTLCSGFQPAEHWKDKLVILMDVGDQSIHALLITWMLWTLYEYNIAHNLRDKLRTVFMVDESRYLLSLDRERQSADFGSPVLDDIICTQRSAGLALVAATQTSFPKNYSTNVGTKILFSCGDARFFHMSTSSMGLSRQQEDWGKLNLGEVGETIVTTFNYTKPLLCLIDKPEITPEPEHLREERRKAFLEKVRTSRSKEEPESQYKEKKPSKPGMVPGALALLKYIAEHPLTPVSLVYKALNLGADQGNRAKQHLEENKLAKGTACQIYKGRGRQPVLLEPTEKGIDYLKQHYPNLQPKLLSGKGGLEHRVHAHLVAKHYAKQGYLVKKEHCDADLGLEHQEKGTWIAVEIANANSRNLEERINRNKEASAERTIIIADERTAKRVAEQMEDCKEVEIRDIEEFLLPRGELVGP